MSEWQDIETAPKDGRPLLLYDATREEPYQCGFWLLSPEGAENDDGAWWIADGRYPGRPEFWAPLSPPPSLSGGRQTDADLPTAEDVRGILKDA